MMDGAYVLINGVISDGLRLCAMCRRRPAGPCGVDWLGLLGSIVYAAVNALVYRTEFVRLRKAEGTEFGKL